MMKYFSKVSISPSASTRDLVKIAGADAYGVHELVWALFADHPERRRDFLFRLERPRGRPVIYVLSERKPESTGSALQIECREWAPRLRSGDVLRFSVRLNPVVSRRDETGRQHRFDVVMDRRFREKAQEKEITPLFRLVQEEGEKWLEERCDRAGFHLEAVTVDGYMQQRFHKRKSSQAVRFNTIDVEGLLRVVDTDRFLTAVHNGLGPAKGFGCGLMLIRRV